MTNGCAGVVIYLIKALILRAEDIVAAKLILICVLVLEVTVFSMAGSYQKIPKDQNSALLPLTKPDEKKKKSCFKNFLQNFGDESQFWWFWDFGIDFKILKKVCKDCSPIFWPILENFDFRILSKSPSYDKPPWRNFDFWSNFWFWRKSIIWNP